MPGRGVGVALKVSSSSSAGSGVAVGFTPGAAVRVGLSSAGVWAGSSGTIVAVPLYKPINRRVLPIPASLLTA